VRIASIVILTRYIVSDAITLAEWQSVEKDNVSK
jgi:hypothetical protein